MDKNTRNKLMLFLIIFTLFIGIISAVYLIFFNKKGEAEISNTNELSKEMSREDIKKIKTAVTGYLKNNYEDYEEISSEKIEIREKSYSDSKKDSVINSTFLIDVPDKKQTFRVNYHWNKNSKDDINSPLSIHCPQSFELIYGKFDCIDQSQSKTEKVDPILSVLPYRNDYYVLSPVQEADGTLTLRADITGMSRSLLEEDYRRMVYEWLSRQGVNPSDYSVFVSLKPIN